jgi:hypothetical protein
MRILFYNCLFFFMSICGFSQIESPNHAVKIAPAKNPDAETKPISETTTPAIIKYESSLNKTNNDKLLKGITLLPKKEEKGIMEKEPLRTTAEIYTKQQNEKLKSEGLSQEIVNSDVYLGEFIVYTTELSTKCRDYGAIDGDNVRIWLNDEIVVTNVSLESGFKSYTLNLKEGLNVIKIQALNIGEFFPNTGQFIFIDGNGKLVTNQNWGLNSGYNAIIKVRKLKGLDTTQEEK